MQKNAATYEVSPIICQLYFDNGNSGPEKAHYPD
jgi:hypothetical protein